MKVTPRFFVIFLLVLSGLGPGSEGLAVADEAPGFAVLGNLGMPGTSESMLTYGGWVTPRQDPTDVEQQRLTFRTPVYRDGRNKFDLSAGGTSLHFGQERILSSGIAVPVDLWRAELGGMYSRKLDEGKSLGVHVSVGSASDHPFADANVTTISAVGFYGWPSRPKSYWLLTLFYSNNNPIANGIPIPGFVYSYRSAEFIGMFGLPFSTMVWMPDPKWMLSFSFFGPTIHSEIAYGDPLKAQIFAGWSWTQQSYLRESRPDPKDRLYFVEMHAPVGVRVRLTPQLKGELSAGYSFDRSIYEGTHFTQANDGRADIGASFYGAWDLRMAL